VRRLVLVRHGQTADNVAGRVQGQGGAGLDEVGRVQAAHLARWLAATHPDARLVSSDLQRCRETAAPLADVLGVPVRLEPRLRERHFGRWQGQVHGDIAARDPALWERFRQGDDVVGEVGGESSPELSARVVAALLDLAAEDDPAPVVVVSHGGSIWHGLHTLLGLPDRTLGPVANAGVTEVGVVGASRVLFSWNHTGHLAGAAGTAPSVTVPGRAG
jgi:glucosyl-3-phosphoglycerate phosphatase